MRMRFADRYSRLLWHTVCHFRYFDQSLLLVESVFVGHAFSHGEKRDGKGGDVRRRRKG
jgi:hypothetical protein